MKILSKVLVGSRLHSLDNENSDWDWRGIHIHPLKEILSPFSKIKNTAWIEGDEDNTSYELADFCKMAVQGNATVLEVFFSNVIKEDSPAARHMRENWRKFIDTDKFVMASRGYAQNQYNKMNLFEPDARTPKFAVAYIRVLWQCWQFLETGKFKCQIEEPWRSYLLEVKHGFRLSMIMGLSEKFLELQKNITDAHAKAERLSPDIAWIEDFIYQTYTEKI